MCVLTVLQKPEREGGPRMAPAVTSFPLRFRDGWSDGPLRWGVLLLRCPIDRYMRIICILMQIYCIVFIFAYNTHYALIRMKHKYFQCIQPYPRIYLQYLHNYTNFCKFAIDFRCEKIYNPFIRSTQTAQARRRRTPWALPRYF